MTSLNFPILFGQNYSPGNTIRLRYERNLIVFPTQFDYVSNAIQLRYNIIQLCMDVHRIRLRYRT